MMDHEEFAEWLLGDGKIERDSISIQYSKDRTKELQNWAKQSLLNGSFSHKDFPVRVKMTGKSIKEFLNQPHKFKKEKNELIKNIGAIFAGSDYKGYTEYHKDNPMIKYSHVFEIELKGEKSWIIVREDITGNAVLYSISDSDKVLTGIKKK